MAPVARQLQLLLMMFASWINRQQLELIGYLLEENRLLKGTAVCNFCLQQWTMTSLFPGALGSVTAGSRRRCCP
jgi:hypothetical protein